MKQLEATYEILAFVREGTASDLPETSLDSFQRQTLYTMGRICMNSALRSVPAAFNLSLSRGKQTGSEEITRLKEELQKQGVTITWIHRPHKASDAQVQAMQRGLRASSEMLNGERRLYATLQKIDPEAALHHCGAMYVPPADTAPSELWIPSELQAITGRELNPTQTDLV